MSLCYCVVLCSYLVAVFWVTVLVQRFIFCYLDAMFY